jgi:hypothetical protein
MHKNQRGLAPARRAGVVVAVGSGWRGVCVQAKAKAKVNDSTPVNGRGIGQVGESSSPAYKIHGVEPVSIQVGTLVGLTSYYNDGQFSDTTPAGSPPARIPSMGSAIASQA